MARLRIRVELNRGGVGVPLHKLASVVEEAQKFLHMVADDIQIDKTSGEWLGFDFDHESLNFTAEFVGPVNSEQVRKFNEAFDGTTPLRRTTIAQFAHITHAIGEDELIGFGLYSADESKEPNEWRCLSRRDALRIAEEIQVLIGAGEEPNQESHLPAVTNSEMGARIFSERRERSMEVDRWSHAVREMETTISQRLDRVEKDVQGHTGQIQELRTKSAATEESMRSLLAAVESFCAQAARQIETISPTPALLAPFSGSSVPSETIPQNRWPKWSWAMIGALGAAAIITSGVLLWPSHPAEPSKPAAVVQTPAPTPKAPEVNPPPPARPPQAAVRPPQAASVASVPTNPAPLTSSQPAATAHVELEATESTWISIKGGDGTMVMSRLLMAGEMRSLDLREPSTLRAGNAGGITIRLNGKQLGPIGPHGSVRDVQFLNGSYKIVDPPAPTAAPAAHLADSQTAVAE